MKTIETSTENNFVNRSLPDEANKENLIIQNDYSSLSILEEEFADEDRSFAQVEKFIGFVI
jgi:hypothetical protein